MNGRSSSNINKYYTVKLNLFFLCSILTLYLVQIETFVFLLLSGLLAVVVYSLIIYKEFKSSEIKFTPVSVLSLSLLLMMGVGSIYQGLTIRGLYYYTLGRVYINIDSLKTGYLMIAVGTFFQFLALQIYRPNKPNSDLKSFSYSKQKLYILFILTLFITKFLSLAFLGMISNFLNVLPIAILSFVTFADKDKLKMSYIEKRNFVIIGSALLFLFNILSLSKLALIYSLLPIIFFYTYKRKNIKKAVITIATLSFIYFGFIQPFVNNTRILIIKQRFTLDSQFLFDYVKSGDYLFNIDPYISNQNNTDIFLSRLFEVGAPSFVYETTEQFGFEYGKNLYYLAVGMVPRVIWPDKPAVPRGAYFAQTYIGQQGVSIGMSIAGELYLNFGWPGIIIGYFLLGLIIGWFWKLLGISPINNLMSFTFYILLLFSSVAGAEFGSVFIGIAQLIIMFLVFRLIQNKILIKHT